MFFSRFDSVLILSTKPLLDDVFFWVILMMVRIFLSQISYDSWHDSNLGSSPAKHVQVCKELEDTLAAALQSARQCRWHFFGDQILRPQILPKSIENGKMIMGVLASIF